MAGDTPDDLEARRSANEKVILDDIAAGLADCFTVPSDEFAAAAMPSRNVKMSENGNGLLQVNSRIDGIEQNFNAAILGISNKIDEKFGEIITRSDNKQTELANRLTKQIADSKPDVNRYTGIAGLLVVVAVAGVGGFFGYVKGTLETDITRGEHISEKLSESIMKLSDNSLARFDRLVDKTMPVSEVLLRTDRNAADIQQRVRRDVFDAAIDPLRNDLETVKKNIVTRSEHEREWTNIQESMGRLASRMTEIDRKDEAFQGRFIGTPMYPDYKGLKAPTTP